jgi:hypothetical protein
MTTVMCPCCLREVPLGESCPVCGTRLADEAGLFEMPMEPLGFGIDLAPSGGDWNGKG